MNITRRTLAASTLIAATALALGACGSSKPQATDASPAADPTTPAATQSATASSVPTVSGYRPGEIPAIPLFSVPSVDVFASNADKAIVDSASKSLNTVPGVTISPAKCDGTSLVSGSTVFGGDGSVVSSSDNGTVINDGQGGGTITEGPISIIYGGDGSGTYSNADTMVSLVVSTDGSGTYTTPTTSIVLDGQGGGNYSNSSTSETITVESDGSGVYSKGTVTIINNGDGTGSYSDDKLTIQNNGDGTATVNGKEVKDAPKVDKLGKLGMFPPVANLKPVVSCGTVITLEDGVLFDFGKSDIRPEAAQTIKSLATVLSSNKVPAAHVYGHTDSVSDEAFNLQLSQERADAVVAELKKDGVSSTLDATGYGESKPVAPNENADGSDNPSGRALNRRVEIFIPAF